MAYYKESSPFNPTFYRSKTNDPNVFNVFWRDKAACDIEHGRGNPTRVVPFSEYVNFTTKKVSSDPSYSGEPIINTFSDPLYEGTRALYSVMCDPGKYDEQGRCWIVHFSPADENIDSYTSGRITIYDCHKISDEKAEISAFGSIGCTLSKNKFLELANRLAMKNWKINMPVFKTAKDVRDFPLFLNTCNEDMLSYLAGVMPELKEDWKAISSHLAEEFFAKVLAETQEGLSEEAILQTIAVGVLGIAHDGTTTSGRSVNYGDTQCPSEARSKGNESSAVNGEVRYAGQVEQCPLCGQVIGRVMEPNEPCPGCSRLFPGFRCAQNNLSKMPVSNNVRTIDNGLPFPKQVTGQDLLLPKQTTKMNDYPSDWIINLFFPWMTQSEIQS